MGEIIRKHGISFKNAFSGIAWAFTTQPNFKVHLVLAAISVLLGLYVNLNALEWVLIVFTIFWALSAEMINTSLEALTDLVTQEWKKEAKIAKDVAAGMMFTVAAGSLAVAILLLLPKLITKLIG